MTLQVAEVGEVADFLSLLNFLSIALNPPNAKSLCAREGKAKIMEVENHLLQLLHLPESSEE